MDYLVYVRHDGENLQFYLWLVDYFQRFMHALRSEQDLSPKWNFENPACSSVDCPHILRRLSGNTLASMATRDPKYQEEQDVVDDFPLEIQETLYSEILGSLHPYDPEILSSLHAIDSNDAPPVQPFRLEIDRIISHYIVAGSPRELNLSHKDRNAVLHALCHTTHPSAFFPIRDTLDSILRGEAHPNFIRWSICNGNKPRTVFLHCFGATILILGFLTAILLTLSSTSRWWRIIAALAWWFGFTNLISAYKGLCIILHRRRTRNVRPWEVGDDEDAVNLIRGRERSANGSIISYADTRSRWPVKMEVFGSSNGSLTDYWMDKWQRKPLWRKIFDEKVKVHEQGLALIQNKIVRQAEAWALIITIPLTAVFVALPKGNMY